MNSINILFILADQHRRECLGCYGNSQIATPALDALARDGVLAENCFCPYPVCTPSRYSLFSSLYARQHGGWSNHSTLLQPRQTFPAILRNAGFQTAAVGKMHFTPTYLDIGFDRMVLAEQDGPGRWDDDYHRELMAQDLFDPEDLIDQVQEYRRQAPEAYWKSWGTLPASLPPEMYSTEWIGRQALRELETWQGGGNMLMVGFIKPHHPMDVPGPWNQLLNPEELDLLPGWTEEIPERNQQFSKGYFPNKELTREALQRVMASYYGSISQIDDQVSQMVELLKRRGLYENTMIVYTSDHGDYMGFQHMILKGNHMYDPLMRVPLIIKPAAGAATTPGGKVLEGLCSNLDLAPTILRHAGLESWVGMEGLDLFSPEFRGRDAVFAEQNQGRYLMIRTPTHKLLLDRVHDRCLLFDLVADPLELEDVAQEAASRGVVNELLERLAAWEAARPAQPLHCDEQAPVIDQPNVPPRDLSHRDAIISWYRQKMDTYLNRS